MADNELEVSGKFGLPEWGGFAAHLEGRFKRTWSDRGRELVEQTAEFVSTSPEALGDLVAATDARMDVFGAVLRRASEVADPAYREALARLLAAACDDARVDEAVYLTAMVTRLEPADLRVFLGYFSFVRRDPQDQWEAVNPWDATAVVIQPRLSGLGSNIGRADGVPEVLVNAARQTLLAVGLLEEEEPSASPTSGEGFVVNTRPPKRVPSELGRALVEALFPNIAHWV